MKHLDTQILIEYFIQQAFYYAPGGGIQRTIRLYRKGVFLFYTSPYIINGKKSVYDYEKAVHKNAIIIFFKNIIYKTTITRTIILNNNTEKYKYFFCFGIFKIFIK